MPLQRIEIFLPWQSTTIPIADMNHDIVRGKFNKYLHRQGISVIPYLGDWLIHHPDRKVLLRHQAQLINTLDLVGFVLNRKKSKLDLTQDIQFLGIRLRLDFPSRVQSLGDSCMHTPSILPPCTNLYSSVPAYGVTQLGLRSYPSGSFVLRPLQCHFHLLGLRDRFSPPCRSDALVLANLLQLAGPTFSYLRNPNSHVSGGFHDFYGRLHAGVGHLHGRFLDFGYLDPYRPQAPHQLFGAQGGSLCPTALGPNAVGPPGYDRYGQFENSFIYQQARRDPFPHLATFDSRTSPLVRGSEHYSPNTTYSRLPERDSRPPISSKSANIDRVVP